MTYVRSFVTFCLLVVSVDRHKTEGRLPLFYGFFVQGNSSTMIQNTGQQLYRSLTEVTPARQEMMKYFNVTKESDLIGYFPEQKMVLHVTTMFCGRGSVASCLSYSQKPEVKQAIGEVEVLEVVGFLVTPRTLGARVRLRKSQLKVWAQNDTAGGCMNKADACFQSCCLNMSLYMPSTLPPYDFHPTSGKGSKGHISLGCAVGISAVTTGFDLVDIEQCETKCIDCKTHLDIGSAEVRYYGQGRFFVYLKHPLMVVSSFNYYA